MKTISKKLFSLLLVVIMLASAIPFQAFAALVNGASCPDSACAGSVKAVAKVDAKCTEDGHSEYFFCSTCNRFFDADGYAHELGYFTIPAKHTPGAHVDPVAGDCITAGTKGYTPCTVCGARLVDGSDGVWTKNKANCNAGLGNHVSGAYVAEVPANCTEAGAKAYTACTKCNARLIAGIGWTTDSTDWAIPVSADAHVQGTFVAEVPATCSEAGTKAYTPCTKCGARLIAGIGWTTESIKWGIPASESGHVQGTYVAEVPATCTEAGTKAYTPCTKCGARLIANVGWTTENWGIPATGHDFSTEVKGADAVDCYKVKCKNCKKYFACDKNGHVTDETPLAADHAPHTLVEGVCSVCGYGMPEGENVASKFEVVIKYVNAAGQQVKMEKVSPVCVILKSDNTYINTDKVIPGTGFAVPADPTTELRFNVKDYFAVPRFDDNGEEMALDKNAESYNKIIAVRRNQYNEVTVKIEYPSAKKVTVKFFPGEGGYFYGSDKHKTMIAYEVAYGSPLPTPPFYEGKDAVHRPLQKWAEDPAGTNIYPYNAGGASNLKSDLNLYAVYDTTAKTNASLNIVFYGTDVTSVTKTLTGLDASEALGHYLKRSELLNIINNYGFGFELVSDKLYKNTSGTTYEANTTIADVNQGNGYVYINVKPTAFVATFYGSDGVVDGLIGNSDYKVLPNLKYGQTKIEMPIPVATESGHTFYGWREKGGEIYKFEPNTKMLFTYNYNRDTFFEPIWNTSAGVYVNVYFNNITNRSLYTVQIHDVQDTLTVNQVLTLLSRYFTWTDFRGLYTNSEWIDAVKNNFVTSAGTKSVDGMSVVLDKDRNEFNLMLLGAKQNGVLISNANLSTIGIGVNANGAYAPADPTNPKTGNEAEMLGVAVASMVMAVVTLAGVTYYTRKKEEKN